MYLQELCDYIKTQSRELSYWKKINKYGCVVLQCKSCDHYLIVKKKVWMQIERQIKSDLNINYRCKYCNADYDSIDYVSTFQELVSFLKEQLNYMQRILSSQLE
jgi:hypothetical protein